MCVGVYGDGDGGVSWQGGGDERQAVWGRGRGR